MRMLLFYFHFIDFLFDEELENVIVSMLSF